MNSRGAGRGRVNLFIIFVSNNVYLMWLTQRWNEEISSAGREAVTPSRASIHHIHMIAYKVTSNYYFLLDV